MADYLTSRLWMCRAHQGPSTGSEQDMFSINPQHLSHEADYRRAELRRAWGGRVARSRRRVVRPSTPDSGRVALAR